VTSLLPFRVSTRQRAEALVAARTALLGPRHPVDEQTARNLIKQGWKPEHYTALRPLGALGDMTSPALPGSLRLPWVAGLVDVAEEALQRSIPFTDLLPWLEVVSGDTDENRAGNLVDTLLSTPWDQYRAAFGGASSATAALAYAAGVEVADLPASGAVDVKGLRMLAALRGFRFLEGTDD
jgi:hypothetical protein